VCDCALYLDLNQIVMLSLNDTKWAEFEGGYRIPYDASIALRKLEKATSPTEIKPILDELWQELHHQGDVGTASYLSVPHLIRIVKEKRMVNPSIIALVAIIEVQRHKNNPLLPTQYEKFYLESIKDLEGVVLTNFKGEWDLETASSVLSALALSKGQVSLADAILRMDSQDIIDEFLECY
jgi:hypothetical protein